MKKEIMNQTRWTLLSNCADFKKVYDYVFNQYYAKNDCIYVLLDTIESELQTYENSSEEKWNVVVEKGEIPQSVMWYCGMIDTNSFLNDYLKEILNGFLEDGFLEKK